MMARHSAVRATGVVSIFGAAGPALDEIGLSAWIAQAAPGETLVYHRGFLAVDATSVISVNGGAKVGHGGGAKPGQLVRMCAMARALPT